MQAVSGIITSVKKISYRKHLPTVPWIVARSNVFFQNRRKQFDSASLEALRQATHDVSDKERMQWKELADYSLQQFLERSDVQKSISTQPEFLREPVAFDLRKWKELAKYKLKQFLERPNLRNSTGTQLKFWRELVDIDPNQLNDQNIRQKYLHCLDEQIKSYKESPNEQLSLLMEKRTIGGDLSNDYSDIDKQIQDCIVKILGKKVVSISRELSSNQSTAGQFIQQLELSLKMCLKNIVHKMYESQVIKGEHIDNKTSDELKELIQKEADYLMPLINDAFYKTQVSLCSQLATQENLKEAHFVDWMKLAELTKDNSLIEQALKASVKYHKGRGDHHSQQASAFQEQLEKITTSN